MSKTQKIAHELLTTERSYVEKLHLIDQVRILFFPYLQVTRDNGSFYVYCVKMQIYHNRIVQENRVLKMLPDHVIPEMFQNIKSIYMLHNETLLPQFEQRLKDWCVFNRQRVFSFSHAWLFIIV